MPTGRSRRPPGPLTRRALPVGARKPRRFNLDTPEAWSYMRREVDAERPRVAEAIAAIHQRADADADGMTAEQLREAIRSLDAAASVLDDADRDAAMEALRDLLVRLSGVTIRLGGMERSARIEVELAAAMNAFLDDGDAADADMVALVTSARGVAMADRVVRGWAKIAVRQYTAMHAHRVLDAARASKDVFEAALQETNGHANDVHLRATMAQRSSGGPARAARDTARARGAELFARKVMAIMGIGDHPWPTGWLPRGA
ncbi:hypothetical protein AB0F17_34230 [Nonomuraea sp. NPDC026600]|uniref:hypothetical protein n=1 Tax=Nonomuraea sp. NPDC026600 TaxID=3155363 RepID=UPI0033D66BF2